MGYITHRLELVRKYAALVIRMVFDIFPGMIWKQELFNYTLQQLRIAVDESVDVKVLYPFQMMKFDKKRENMDHYMSMIYMIYLKDGLQKVVKYLQFIFLQ